MGITALPWDVTDVLKYTVEELKDDPSENSIITDTYKNTQSKQIRHISFSYDSSVIRQLYRARELTLHKQSLPATAAPHTHPKHSQVYTSSRTYLIFHCSVAKADVRFSYSWFVMSPSPREPHTCEDMNINKGGVGFA